MACGPHMSAFSLSHLRVGSTCHHLPRSPRRHQLHATRPRYPAAPLLHSPRALPARGRPHRALALAELDRYGELPREAPRAPVKVGCHGELSRGREWGHRRRLMLNSVAAASSYHHAPSELGLRHAGPSPHFPPPPLQLPQAPCRRRFSFSSEPAFDSLRWELILPSLELFGPSPDRFQALSRRAPPPGAASLRCATPSAASLCPSKPR